MLRHLETGILITPDSSIELADALVRLKDPDERARLGQAGRVFAEEHLSWDHIADRLTNFFVEVVAHAT